MRARQSVSMLTFHSRTALIAGLVVTALALLPSLALAGPFTFTSGDLVVLVEGNGDVNASSGPYTDNQAAPITLFQYTLSGTAAATFSGSLVLPTQQNGANFPVAGEYGSSSEGTLHLSGNGEYLTLAGYGVNPTAFNQNPTSFGTTTNDPTKPTALGQSGSLLGQNYTAVPRVVALVGADGSVDSTTALYGVFNGNNPRSAYTVDGSTIYVSGQGNSPDHTGGVFVASRGATTATPVTGDDTTGKTFSQDTRDVQVVNGQLVVSVDSKAGSNAARDFIGTLGAPGSLPTGPANSGNGPTMLSGFGNSGGTGKITVTTADENAVNKTALNSTVNLSPENYFFANPSTLYVADGGNPKNNSATSSLGDGGLQKWTNSEPDGSGVWTLDYTLSTGLGLVANSASEGTTGLYGLTGIVVGDSVELFATNLTVGDTDPTFLFGITDVLDATSAPSGETFSLLASAPADSTFKGVSFAPEAVPEPTSLVLLAVGLVALVVSRRR